MAPTSPDWRRRTVRSGPVDLAVFEAGDPEAPTVMMVHGWPDTHHLWNGVAARLADEFHVVAYDTRGMGETTDPGSVPAFGLGHLAGDLFAVAEAVSPDAPVHLLAHDWGSTQGWEAVTQPRAEGRIASFVSISGPSIDHAAHWMRSTLRQPTARSARSVLVQNLASSYMWVFISPLGPLALRRFRDPRRWAAFLERREGITPSPDHHGDTFPDDIVSGLRYYRANLLRHLRRPRDRRTSVPVLLLVPTRDAAIRPDGYEQTGRWAEDLARRDVPYGHWVALARPDVVAEEAARFIRERAAPRAS